MSRLAWGVWVEIAVSTVSNLIFMSRLAWGVWVEIRCTYINIKFYRRHASHEACELKYFIGKRQLVDYSHASHEACELKLNVPDNFLEIHSHASHEACELKFLYYIIMYIFCQSRLAWGVWVEIRTYTRRIQGCVVTPRMRRVSWNRCLLLTCS